MFRIFPDYLTVWKQMKGTLRHLGLSQESNFENRSLITVRPQSYQRQEKLPRLNILERGPQGNKIYSQLGEVNSDEGHLPKSQEKS